MSPRWDEGGTPRISFSLVARGLLRADMGSRAEGIHGCTLARCNKVVFHPCVTSVVAVPSLVVPSDSVPVNDSGRGLNVAISGSSAAYRVGVSVIGVRIKEYDSRGVRTPALSDCGLNAAP